MCKKVLFRLSIFVLCVFPLTSWTSASNDSVANIGTFLEFNLEQRKCTIDGKLIHADTYPEIENTTVFLPLRTVAESFGYKVEWKPDSKQVLVSKLTQTIMLSIDSNTVYLKDLNFTADIPLDIAPKSIDGTVMVPECFVKECLGCRLYRDDKESKVLIAAVGPNGQKIGADVMMSYLKSENKADAEAVIAVIDTGADVGHPFLQSRIVQAYNAVENSADVTDVAGHGTAVAGIIANCTPETVKIMPIKVDTNANFEPEDIVKAINYAVERNVKVINISLSAALSADTRIVSGAITDAVRNGCSVIVAAGNEHGDVLDYTPSNVENAIVVTALSEDNRLLDSSNYGSTVVVAAPGAGIISTTLGGTYGIYSGTSMAAPFVAAAITMIRMDIPGITPNELRNLLLDYSTDIGEAGWDPEFGGGMIDLAQYVSYRKNGIIGDLIKSMAEKTGELDKQIERFRQQKLEEHLKVYGFFLNPIFASELVMEAQRLYEVKDYFAAGYYYEKALSYADDNTVQNNLAYMMRRGEYVSNRYSIQPLLDKAKASGNTYAFVNDALLTASKGQWEKADKIIKELCQQNTSKLVMDSVKNFWKELYYQKDAEGALVLAWLMRYNIYVDTVQTQQELCQQAMEKYPTIPEWLGVSVLKEEEK